MIDNYRGGQTLDYTDGLLGVADRPVNFVVDRGILARVYWLADVGYLRLDARGIDLSGNRGGLGSRGSCSGNCGLRQRRSGRNRGLVRQCPRYALC